MMQGTSELAQACVVWGPVVAATVAALKRLGYVGRFIARNAKAIAAIASVVVTAVTAGVLPVGVDAWQQFGLCVAITFAGGVATHEMLDHVGKGLGMPDPKHPKDPR